MSGINFDGRNRISPFTITPVPSAQFDKPRDPNPKPLDKQKQREIKSTRPQEELEAASRLAAEQAEAQNRRQESAIEKVLPAAKNAWHAAKSALTQNSFQNPLTDEQGIALTLMVMKYTQPTWLAQIQSGALAKLPTGGIQQSAATGMLYTAPGDRGMVLGAIRLALESGDK
jgi:hypothetical protein